MAIRSRTWCFTLNNPTPEELEYIKENDLKEFSYIIVGEEVGKQGTPHLQGYIEFENQRTFTALKKLLPRCHIEKAKGTGKENQVYCSKEGRILREAGEMKQQGKRSDIDEIKDQIKSGETRMAVLIDNASSYQSVRFAETLIKYKEKTRDWEPVVKWFYGDTGTGKTRTAMEELGKDVFICMDSIKWWEGYDGHANVLIDDIRSTFCGYTQLLKLLDRYPYRVEVKGGSRQFLARNIIITAPFPPDGLYPALSEDIGQLLRRIKEIRLFPQKKNIEE